ncbi:hypothetical protein QBC40DRAFT_165901 [Triangularia verruculosa]|uniref:SnoaL-like domain-containing protein n=1 Tax=Triangularia verruculosa TaxID=2587418 RepID=A0AAN6XP34_9PEZI|nr:hypothetical protein QBC40DRAFT_165901 [Triangularia verruculosa]
MKFVTIALVLWPGIASAIDSTQPNLENVTQDLLRVESVRQIKNIQRTYAQLAQHGRWKEMADLFADDGILRWGKGTGDILSTTDAESVVGRSPIESWLRQEAGDMDGTKPGSLHVFMSDMPVITLADNGLTAKGRWTALRKLGDGKGRTRIEGGIFENEYVSGGGKWKISLLRYYPLYAGNYETGWKNLGVNGSLPVIPYHYTLDQAGLTLLHTERKSLPAQSSGSSSGQSTPTKLSLDELEYRVAHLNEEDEVRNLVNGMGYYVDRRMWPDVISLFVPNGTITIQNNTSPPGPASIQSVLNRMGPEGLSHGILNEHPIFGTVIQVSPDHKTATARGLEIGLIGDSNVRKGQWRFCVFHHSLVKDLKSGIWKIQDLSYYRLLFADYAAGWGNGGILPASSLAPPPILSPHYPSSPTENRRPVSWRPFYKRYLDWEEEEESDSIRLAKVQRLLLRSSAYDESENTSGSYGFYIDDIRCSDFAKLHSERGHKLSPGIGWYYTPNAISLSCASRYYRQNTTTYNPSMSSLRSSVPFHWRLQPVILVSQDGRSATLRTRNLQTGTSRTQGSNGWMGGMYHDQLVLEGEKRKLWSITIDEFYWNSRNWTAGWANVVPVTNTTTSRRWLNTISDHKRQTDNLDPDVSLRHPALAERETGFNGGPAPTVSWPGVQRMWWAYRNLVTGAIPSDNSYWGPPGCVPCRGAKPEWALRANGYQEPPSGPTIVTADWAEGSGVDIEITVKGGPEESSKGGWVQLVTTLHGEDTGKVGQEGPVGDDGKVVLRIRAPGIVGTGIPIEVFYFGNENLKPGKGILVGEPWERKKKGE